MVIPGLTVVGELPGPGPWSMAIFNGVLVAISPNSPPQMVMNGKLVAVRFDALTPRQANAVRAAAPEASEAVREHADLQRRASREIDLMPSAAGWSAPASYRYEFKNNSLLSTNG